MEPIASALFYYYNDPDSAGMPYDGGWTFDVNITTENALAGIPLECHDDLLEDIAGSFENGLWVEAAGGHWASSHLSKIMAFFWQRFVQTVKHESRFFFSNSLSTSHSYDEFPPTKILAAIGKIVIDLGLVHPIIKKTKLFRVRERSSGAAWELDADQLGPPPKENAQSQRMNPAGISYFYLAKERATALAEVLSKPPCRGAMGSFEVCRDLLVVDLSQLPEIPSIFDSNFHNEREITYFLYDFVNEISKPVQKDGREHLDYIPSQVVCQYFAKVFRTEKEMPVDGLAYPSAILPGGINIVLFPSRQQQASFADLVKFSKAEEIEFSNWLELSDAIR
jgi:RES domain-containing protein